MLGILAFLDTLEAYIIKYGLLFPVDQLVYLVDDMLLGQCGLNVVNKNRLGIGINVDLSINEPVIALFGLMNFRIQFAICVFGQGWYFDESGIKDGALLEQQSSISQHRVDFFKEQASP